MDNPKKVRNHALGGILVGILFLVGGIVGNSTLGTALGFIVISCSVAVFVVAALLAKAS